MSTSADCPRSLRVLTSFLDGNPPESRVTELQVSSREMNMISRSLLAFR
jgi:hypothetical protein